MNLYIWNEGLLAPQNGNPNTYESFRMEAYQIFGTPNEIWETIQIVTSTKDVHIDEIDDTKINIFPNPTNDIVNIQFTDITVQKISLMDNLGRDLTSNIRYLSKSEEQVVLDLSKLSTGLYYLIINDKVIRKIQKN
jgi:hypothetical protein